MPDASARVSGIVGMARKAGGRERQAWSEEVEMPDVAFVVRSVELPNQVKLPYVEQGDSSGVPVVLLLLGSPATLQDKPAALEVWGSTVSKLTDPADPGFVREFAEGTLAQPVPQAFVETMVQESLKVPGRVWRATFEGLLEDDAFGELNKINAPALIVWGDHDAFLPRADQEKLKAAITGSRLVVYPGAGHAVHREEPDRVASDLAAFIEGLAE
jgi:non-heme chloroperoxidase